VSKLTTENGLELTEKVNEGLCRAVTKAVAARETRWRINKKSLIKLWAY
jgi:hypothetical protein